LLRSVLLGMREHQLSERRELLPNIEHDSTDAIVSGHQKMGIFSQFSGAGANVGERNEL
jgi:hypothetical protein